MNTDDIVIIDTINEEMKAALDALAGSTFDSEPGVLSGQVWTVRTTLRGWPTVTLAFDREGAATMAAAFPGNDTTSEDAAIAATIRDICTQALGAAATRPPATGGRPEIERPELAEWPVGIDATVTTFRTSMLSKPLTIGVSTASMAEAVETLAAAGDELAPQSEPSAVDRLSVILDIDLPLVVRFGCTEMPLKALTKLGPGSLIDLSRSPDDPVDVLVSNRVVARGEVVVVGGSYGIRILDVVSPRERLRGLEG